jgi:hypothetical protein
MKAEVAKARQWTCAVRSAEAPGVRDRESVGVEEAGCAIAGEHTLAARRRAQNLPDT